MYTFVIDIHGGVAELDIAAPFLHPVHQLLQVVKLPNNSFVSLEKAADDVCKYLERNFLKEWQVIFLVNLNLQHENPLVGSLTHYLLVITEKFLNPLKRHVMVPKNVFVIAADSVNRDQRGRPLNPDLAIRWELDTRGYQVAPQMEDFTFAENEIEGIDTLWGTKLSVKDERFGKGFKGLSEKLQNQLKERHTKIEDGFLKLLGQKKQLLKELKFSDELINSFLQRNWQEIKEEFLATIKYTLLVNPESPNMLENYSPSKILKGVIRNHFGIHSSFFDTDFLILHFPFHDALDNEIQKKILDLAFLVIAIAENEPGTRLSGNEIHVVEIHSDEKSAADFSELLFNYRKCLSALKEKLLPKSGELSTEINLYTSSDDICTESISVRKIEGIKFGFLADYHSTNELTQWKGDIENEVDKSIDDSQNKISNCVTKNYKKKTEVYKEPVEDIRSKTAELKRDYQIKLESLPKEDFIISKDKGFDELVRDTCDEINAELKRRPTRNQYIVTLFGAYLLLLGAIVPYVKKTEFLLVALVGSFLPTLVAALLSRKHFFYVTKRAVKKIVENSNQMIIRIKTKFENQKVYLRKLLNVNISRKNYLEGERIYNDIKREQLLSNYHLRMVKNYLKRANNLCKLYPLQNPNYEGFTKKDFQDLQLEKPVSHNHVYAPACFLKNRPAFDCRIGVDDGYETQASQYLHAVNRIDFKKDNIFSNGE